jgi:hypothetical protein
MSATARSTEESRPLNLIDLRNTTYVELDELYRCSPQTTSTLRSERRRIRSNARMAETREWPIGFTAA